MSTKTQRILLFSKTLDASLFPSDPLESRLFGTLTIFTLDQVSYFNKTIIIFHPRACECSH